MADESPNPQAELTGPDIIWMNERFEKETTDIPAVAFGGDDSDSDPDGTAGPAAARGAAGDTRWLGLGRPPADRDSTPDNEDVDGAGAALTTHQSPWQRLYDRSRRLDNPIPAWENDPTLFERIRDIILSVTRSIWSFFGGEDDDDEPTEQTVSGWRPSEGRPSDSPEFRSARGRRGFGAGLDLPTNW